MTTEKVRVMTSSTAGNQLTTAVVVHLICTGGMGDNGKEQSSAALLLEGKCCGDFTELVLCIFRQFSCACRRRYFDLTLVTGSLNTHP